MMIVSLEGTSDLVFTFYILDYEDNEWYDKKWRDSFDYIKLVECPDSLENGVMEPKLYYI